MKSKFQIWRLIEDDFFEMCRILNSTPNDWNERILRETFSNEYRQWGVFFQEALLGFLVVKK